MGIQNVHGVQTQGRKDSNQWVKTFMIKISDDGNTFRNVQDQEFNGNNDKNTIVTNAFTNVVRARYIRIYPKQYNNHRSLRFAVLLCEAPTTDLKKLVEANGEETLNENYWENICKNIPSEAEYLKLVMGNVADFYKPSGSNTMCQMLKSNNKHLWSEDGKTWIQPKYDSTASNFGGSEEDWPSDGRKRLSYWGRNSDDTFGCCNIDYNSESIGWNAKFVMYYGLPIEKETFTSRGEGTCPDMNVEGKLKTVNTIQECRDSCEPHYESYFSIKENDNAFDCYCFDDCDTLSPSPGEHVYEIISNTMQSYILGKDNDLALSNNLNSELLQENFETGLKFSTCEAERTTCEVEREKWESRFTEVQRMEQNNPLSAQVLANENVEVNVGASMTETNPNCGSNRSIMNNALFSFGGLALGFALAKVFSTKNTGDSVYEFFE